jgi:hypothetical protein
MKKISTLFKKDPADLGRVINEVNSENEWVMKGEGIPTRKWDGTACAIFNRELYKRYDVKKGKHVPDGAIPCQEADPISGHWPHWVKCDRNNPADKYHFEGFDSSYIASDVDSTFELVGPKINGNPEKMTQHLLIEHQTCVLPTFEDYSFEGVKNWLENNDVEGVVFHHKSDSRMCKIRKSDFGINR